MRERRSRFFALAVVLTGLVAMGADGAEERPHSGVREVSLPNTEVRSLYSEIVGQEYRLLVALPRGWDGDPEARYPVVYLLDGDLSFPLARQTALSLQFGRELPPVLIVGIGYAGGHAEGVLRRTRDYTPTKFPVFTEYAERWGGGETTSGGGEAFLRFVRQELQPFVEASYPADPDDATIFGVSFGGLFATYVLLKHPGTFERYVIGSPSLWWDERAIFGFESAYAAENDDLSARVFMAAGGRERREYDEAALAKMPAPQRQAMLEFQEAIGGGAQMLEVVEPFARRLEQRGYPSLDFTLHVFPDETHASVPPMILSRGLRVVFETF